ncbi:sarcosine oxidase [Fusarium verticillioides 7600]|uniref:Sarcosine oxidase n=1 Tax=Gibberella moniliformis (strain M3125 / FGSC 7600) TaxID=334819 RepID=W7ML74_GIBM7|nr:sarcosine oxidase [Fusarium verticillioides 7600]EWG48514.1 sarcosine oxidase [Fusarium verticillioides 7600]
MLPSKAPELSASSNSSWAKFAALLGEVVGDEDVDYHGRRCLSPQKGPTPSSDFTTSLDANDVPYELLTPEETNKRWPVFNVPQGVDTVFTPDSGIVHAAKAVMTLQFQARVNGAILGENTCVEAVTPQPSGGIAIETSQGVYHARKVIIAADAWTNKLLKPLGVELPITVTQEQVTYFKPSREHEAQFSNDKFPVWI